MFFTLWLSYGLLINDENINDFKQSQATIEAIVDERRFSVDNLPVWKPEGDFFHLDGRTYMNKQPGQALVGAAAYAHLRLFGLSYTNSPLLTAALVIFLTTSLLSAIAGLVVFFFVRDLGDRRATLWPVAAALTYGWGTIAFAYSGIAHHDAIAAAFLISGFYLCFRIGYAANPGADRIRSVGAGVLLGLTLTTSMIPFFMVAVVGLYFLSLRRWELLPRIIFGGALGLLPMLAYNAINFGNPLTLPMSLFPFHPVDDVYFKFDWFNFYEKLYVYYSFTNWYGPVLWFAVAGLFFLFFRRPREASAIALAIIVLVFYISNIQTLGTCNYGPRFMLGLMPIAALGVGGFQFLPGRPLRGLAAAGLVYVGLQSASINLVGAIGGPMYCNLPQYAYPGYLAEIWAGKLPTFTLPWLAVIGVFVLALVAVRLVLGENKSEAAHTGTVAAAAVRNGTTFDTAGAAVSVVLVLIALTSLYRIWTIDTGSAPRLVATPPPPGAPTLASATPSPAASPLEPAAPANAFTGGKGNAPGKFNAPRGIDSDRAGNLYVADSGNGRVQKFDVMGAPTLSIGDGRLTEPIGVAVDEAGAVFVTDAAKGVLVKFASDGTFVREWPGPEPAFYGPRDIVFGPNRQLYIVDQGRTRIVKFDPASESFSSWGTRGDAAGQLIEPTGIAAGVGEIFVADLGNNRIQVFDLDGKFLREWAVPVWERYPWHYPDVVVDAAGKTVYATNGWRNEVLAFDASGNAEAAVLPIEGTVENPSSLLITGGKDGHRLLIVNTGSSKLTSFPLKSGGK